MFVETLNMVLFAYTVMLLMISMIVLYGIFMITSTIIIQLFHLVQEHLITVSSIAIFTIVIVAISVVFRNSKRKYYQINLPNMFTSPSVVYDVVYIGAGVGNITSAHWLEKNNPDNNFIMFDIGNNVTRRDRNNEYDSVTGVGGPGFLSDGKFSFFNKSDKSATKLWQLEKKKITTAYNFVKDVLKPYSTEIPDISILDESSNFESQSEWKMKDYHTIYLSFEQRKQLMCDISVGYYDKPNNRLLLQSLVKKIEKDDEKKCYKITFVNVDPKNNPTQGIESIVYAKKIVYGGGRFMPLVLSQMKQDLVPLVFKRTELGARFEGPADHPIYNTHTNFDPKWMKKCNKGEWEYEVRSFCHCRKGEVACTNFNGIKTYSGRSDCQPTNVSNFGFNIRFKNEKSMEFLNKVINTEPYNFKISEIDKFIEMNGEFGKIWIDELDSFVFERTGIKLRDFPDDFKIIGPTIEGVGYYPKLDENLKVKNENIWFIGDATGEFRGIVAAMVSGVYVAQQF